MKTFYATIISALVLAGCNQWQVDGECLNLHNQQLNSEGAQVSYTPVTAADYSGPIPVTSLNVPDAGEEVKSEDIRTYETAFLAEADDIRNNAVTGLANKVDRTGDTMTGSLTIAPSAPTIGLNVSAGAGSNLRAALFQGDGTSEGVRLEGGANGPGATAAAGGGNNFGFRGIGTGTEPGLIAIGDSDAIVQTLVNGGIRIADTPPAATADPGADNTAWSQSLNSSSALVTSDGAGNFAVNANGFNVATFAGTAGGVGTVTFARALPGNNYRIMVFATDPYTARWNNVQNVGNYQFIVKDAAGNPVDLTTVATTFFVTTVGY